MGQKLLLNLKLTTLFWFRRLTDRALKTYHRIRRNRLHFVSVVTTLALLLVSVGAYISAIPPVLASEEKERIGFILSTHLDPTTLDSNDQFGLQPVAYAGQNVGGSLPVTGADRPKEHVVAGGETLSGIAIQYGLSSLDFMSANPSLEDRDSIYPGQVLVVPVNAVSPEEAEKILAQIEVRKAEEAKKVAASQKTKNARIAAATPSGRFVNPISYSYISQWFQGGHTGLDMVASPGTAVKAATTGCVIHAATGWNGGYGTVIILKESGTTKSTLYAHLSQINVKMGECVEAGEVIARSGNTGRSTGPHLHFEVRLNGRSVNPMTYLR